MTFNHRLEKLVGKPVKVSDQLEKHGWKDAMPSWEQPHFTRSKIDSSDCIIGNKRKLGSLASLLKVDLLESQVDYHLRAELPGIPKENVEITCNKGCLTIQAERFKSTTTPRGHNDAVFHIAERGNGKVERAFHIPHDANTSKIEATFELGVLTIKIPKLESAVGPVSIPVKIIS